MITKCTLLILSNMLILFSTYGRAEPANDKFNVFVNNQLVSNGESISVSNGASVTYEIQKTSDLPVRLDPTGKNAISFSFQENLTRFTTTYNPGQYSPIVAVGESIKHFKLNVDKGSIDWILLLPKVIWPITLLLIFLVIFIWGGLRDLLSRLTTAEVEIGGVKFKAEDVGKAISNELHKSKESLFSRFPENTATSFLPSSLDEEASYDIHVFSFLDTVGVRPKDKSDELSWSRAWTIVGNFYFERSEEKSLDAYKKAIEMDGENPIAYANLGMLLFWQTKDYHLAKRYFKLSLEAAETACVICSTAYMGMVLIAEKYDDEENEKLYCEKAKEEFNRSVEKDPTDFWSWYGLGWSWSYSNYNYEKAIKYTSKALEIRTDFLAARYNLACFQALNGDAQKSLETLKEMLYCARQTLQHYGFETDKDLVILDGNNEFSSFRDVMKLKYEVLNK